MGAPASLLELVLNSYMSFTNDRAPNEMSHGTKTHTTLDQAHVEKFLVESFGETSKAVPLEAVAAIKLA